MAAVFARIVRRSMVYGFAASLFVFELYGGPIHAADAPAIQPPRTYAGKIPNPNDNDDVSPTTNVLGHHGTLLIRSGWRYRDALNQFAKLGWHSPQERPLKETDFSKQMIVCVFDCGDEGNTFSVRTLKTDTKPSELDLLMKFAVYKRRDRIRNAGKFLLVAAPTAAVIKVTVSTYYDGDPKSENASPARARLEWSALLGGNGGDVVDDLQAKIEPSAKQVQVGGDIRLRFTLTHADAMQVDRGQFGRRYPQLAVWDGKYSNGYRNHGFEVRQPDGTTVFVQPKEVLSWRKNVPHLVSIPIAGSYVLPNWFEGETYKSLKDLGIATTQPGIYTVTGIYTETGELTAEGQAEPRLTWGGRIASNTVKIEVAP